MRRIHLPVRSALAACLLAATVIPAAMAGVSYHEETLENGMRVILVRKPASPMIASNVIVGAGVVHEPEGMNGASHFLEHLLFNGTETRTQRQLYDEIDRYGAFNNATTREDHTLFMLVIQREFAEKGMEIQADMLFHSILPPEKFEKEKGIVLEELAKDKNDPGYIAGRAMREFAYEGTPMGRSVLGTEESISNLKRDDVRAYYKSRYVPDNMTLVVMGGFETKEMLEAVKKIFGAAPKSKRLASASGAWPERPEANVMTGALVAGRVYVHVAFPVTVSPHDPLMPAIELLIAGIADGEDAPLAQALKGGEEPHALSFSLSVSPRVFPWTSVEFEAVVPPGTEHRAILDRLERALRTTGRGSTARDRIAPIRASARAEEVLLADQLHYFPMMRSAYLRDAPDGYLQNRLAMLDAVGDEDLDRAARLLLDGLAQARVTVSGPGVQAARSVWKPEAEIIETAAGAGRVDETLPSGMQLIFERNDDSEVLGLHLMFRPRAASEPAGKQGIAALLHRLFLEGSLVRDAAGLDSALAAVGAKLKTSDSPWIPYDDYYTTPEFSYVRLEMPASRWREGLALLGEVVLHPRLEEGAVGTVKRRVIDLQKRKEESPRARAAALTVRALAPGQPISSPVLGTPESVGSVTVADLRSFHGSYVAGSRMILTGVGPIRPVEFSRAVRAVFGNLPAGDKLPEVKPAPLTKTGLRASEELGKEQAYLTLAYLFDAKPEDWPALSVAVTLLSDKLSFRLREEMGLAYSMGASVRASGGRTMFRATMGTRAENLDEALAGLREGIAAFRDGEPDPDAVARAASALRGRLLMRRMTQVNKAYFAAIERLEGRPPGDDGKRLDALLRVGTDDVQRAARAYLDPERCAVIVIR